MKRIFKMADAENEELTISDEEVVKKYLKAGEITNGRYLDPYSFIF